ncbi:hypothetical protein QTV49_000487 [Vibrio vulnificus]|nr:hypothetical protein [Vibrio vulnificus]
MNTVSLQVPFVYRAQVIKPRCRKPVEINVSDVIQVEIKCITESDIPVAFRTPQHETRWFDNSLWGKSFHTVTDEKPVLATLEQVVANTNDSSDYKWSSSSPIAPFFNVWHNVRAPWDTGYCTPSPWLKDENVMPLDQHVYRELVEDNRDAVVERILKTANSMLSVDGVIYEPECEPMYYLVTFGLGRNHGGTSLSVTTLYNRNIPHRCYFRADQREEALKYATEVAENRGDTESLPFEYKVPVIEILIPEAVQANPAVDHPVE